MKQWQQQHEECWGKKAFLPKHTKAASFWFNLETRCLQVPVFLSVWNLFSGIVNLRSKDGVVLHLPFIGIYQVEWTSTTLAFKETTESIETFSYFWFLFIYNQKNTKWSSTDSWLFSPKVNIFWLFLQPNLKKDICEVGAYTPWSSLYGLLEPSTSSVYWKESHGRGSVFF